MADRTPSKWLVAAVAMLIVWGYWQPVVDADVRQLAFSPAQRITMSGNSDEVTISDPVFAVQNPVITGDPSFRGSIQIAFISNADGNSEVYTATLAIDTSSTPPTISLSGPPDQITQTTTSIQAHPIFGLLGPVLTFQSNNSSLDPSVGNADLSPETFWVDLVKTPPPAVVIHQLTKYPSPSGLAPLQSVNPTGRISQASSTQGLVVFSSNSNSLPNTSNPEGNPEIFIYDPLDDKYYQVTSTAAGVQNLHPVINASGMALAYVSNASGSFNVYVHALKSAFIIPPPPFTNHAPTISVTGQTTVNPNQQVTLTVTADDPDLNLGDVLTLTATAGNGAPLPSGATFKTLRDCPPANPNDPACKLAVNTGIFSWKPTTVGAYDINFIVTDLAGLTGSQLVTIDVVAPPDRAPTISPGSFGTRIIKIGKPITISVSGSDPDGDAVSLDFSQKPAAAQVTCSGNGTARASCTLTWTPQSGDEGSGSQDYPITATVSANGKSATATGTITVVFNQKPIITTGNATVPEFACLMLVVNATDPDGDPLTMSIDPSTMPTTSVWWGGLRTLHWHPGADTPDGSFVPPGGQRTFPVNFTVTDGTDTVAKTITITVTDTDINANQIVTSTSASLTVLTGQTVSISTGVRNTGYSTWSAAQGYALAPQTTSTMPVNPVPLAPGETVAPGALKTFTGSVTAPMQTGFYAIRWRMSQAGTQFGPYSMYTFLKVVKPPTTPPAPP